MGNTPIKTESEWWEKEPFCVIIDNDFTYGQEKRYNIPAIIAETRRMMKEEMEDEAHHCQKRILHSLNIDETREEIEMISLKEFLSRIQSL